ncbi:MAG: SiaB family protein kinase [Bacteroidia bacterium]|nr:SiaB family protein kinase [Bacteroidia bacterium]
MKAKNYTENEFFKEKFNEYLDFFSKKNFEFILAYDGVINQDTISKLESEIEEKVLSYEFPKSIVKKIFFIAVELLQNLFIHGAEDDTHTKHNFIIITKNNHEIIILTANLIHNHHVNKIKNIFDTINGFKTYDELKKYYMERLENNDLSDKGGAGLGFITIGLKSQPPLEYSFEKINDKFSYFQLSVKLFIND